MPNHLALHSLSKEQAMPFDIFYLVFFVVIIFFPIFAGRYTTT